MVLLKVVKAILVRCSLVLHVIITVWRVTVDLDDDLYWLLALIMIPFFIEGAYTILKRHGEDFLLFTPCFFFYLMTTIPCIWLLELKKSDSFLDEDEGQTVVDMTVNGTNSSVIVEPAGPDFGVDINPGTWTVLIEELLLYLLIVSRWLLPRGKVSREQLSELLFAFIGIASDIMEMFSLFGLEDVRRNRTLSYLVLACWTIAILQFCMTVTVIHEPRRAKVIKTIDDNDYEKEKPKIWRQILAVFCSMMMQDIPFLTLRLYTIITYDIINYSLVFFTAKNVLVILLLLYKIAVLIQKRYCPEFLTGDKEDDDVEKQIYDDDPKGNGRLHSLPHDFLDNSHKPKGKKGKENKGFHDIDDLKKSSDHGSDGKPTPTTVSTTDAGSTISYKSLNQPNETTPLRQRKADGVQPQQSTDNNSSSPQPSRPASAKSDQFPPATPREEGNSPVAVAAAESQTPPAGTPRSPPSEAESQPKDTPIASGYGWISSKKN